VSGDKQLKKDGTRKEKKTQARKREFEQPVVGAVTPQKGPRKRGRIRRILPRARSLHRTGRKSNAGKSDVTGATIRFPAPRRDDVVAVTPW
jgi:hypothetical protein